MSGSVSDAHIKTEEMKLGNSNIKAKPAERAAVSARQCCRGLAATMTNTALTLAMLGAGCGTALAQTSVTLYGVADADVEFANHVGVAPTPANNFNPGPGNKVYRMNSGGLSGSRWGLRGTEDLGGGLSSIFVLESGFNQDAGTSQQGGRLFGRSAYVGLASKDFGQVALGRQYTSLFDVMANFVPALYATSYEPSATLLGPNYREDNTVKYKGVFGPLSASAHWSFGTGLAVPQTSPLLPAGGGGGEVPGQFRRDSAYGVGLSYIANGLGIAAGYDQFNPTFGTGTGTFKNAAIAGSYAFGNAKVMGGYRWGQNRGANGSLVKRDDYYWIGGQYQFTPALGLIAEFAYDDIKNLFGNKSIPNPWQINLIGTYSFSKRTDLYLTAAYSKNAGLGLDSLANGFANSLALGNSYTLGRGESNMLGIGLGVRHKF